MSKQFALLCFFCAVLNFASDVAGARESGERGPVIGVCVMGTRHPYFRDMLDEMEMLAGRAGVRIVSGDADFNAERQRQIVEGFIASRVSLIMVAPFDAKDLHPTLVKAGRAGIPVMTVDAASAGYDVISHCASDNVAGGRLAAGLLLERLAEKRTGSGTVLVFDHAGVTSTFQRVKGFSDVMALRGKEHTLRVIDAVGQTPLARRNAVAAFQAPDNRIVAIFASNDGMTLGALEAVEESGKLADTVIIGYDYVEESRNAVDAGKIAGIVVQFPRRIADAAFKIAHDYVTGRNVNPPKEVLVEVGTYTQEGFRDQRGNVIEM